jgi:hypothetical protein
MSKNVLISNSTELFITVFVLHAIILCGVISAKADEISFRCTVKAEYKLTDDGQLVEAKSLYYRGSSFSIDRSTGRILGGAFNNKGDYQMKVIDGGSFKVFSFAENRGVAESLSIKTWLEAEKKPFVGIDYLQTVVTGVCD